MLRDKFKAIETLNSAIELGHAELDRARCAHRQSREATIDQNENLKRFLKNVGFIDDMDALRTERGGGGERGPDVKIIETSGLPNRMHAPFVRICVGVDGRAGASKVVRFEELRKIEAAWRCSTES
jgi:hypothetical protein